MNEYERKVKKKKGCMSDWTFNLMGSRSGCKAQRDGEAGRRSRTGENHQRKEDQPRHSHLDLFLLIQFDLVDLEVSRVENDGLDAVLSDDDHVMADGSRDELLVKVNVPIEMEMAGLDVVVVGVCGEIARWLLMEVGHGGVRMGQVRMGWSE